MSLFGATAEQGFVGFPRAFLGANGLFIFRVQLDDGTFRDATVRRQKKRKYWIETGTGKDLTDRVGIWWETYTCAQANAAIRKFVEHPSLLAQEEITTAFRRHIFLESEVGGAPACQECFRFWQESSQKND